MRVPPKAFILASLLLILLCGLKLTYQLQDYLDIGLHDESLYMWSGITFFNAAPNPQGGPLYSLWYHLLYLFQPDRIKLYYLNQALLTILPPLFIFLLLVAYRVPLALGLLLAIFFLCSNSNLPIWPKVSVLVLLLVTAATALLPLVQSRLNKFLLFSTLALLCAYIRPELYVAFILLGICALLLLLHGVWHQKLPAAAMVPAGLPVALAVILQSTLGNPMGGNRSIIAFGQHFASNYLTWTNGDLNAWNDWPLIMAENFGESTDSIVEALLANPPIFFKHLLQNVGDFAALWANKSSNIVYPGSLFFGSNNQPLVLWFKILLLGGLAVGLTRFVVRTFAQRGNQPRPQALLTASKKAVRAVAGRFTQNLSARRWELVLLGLLLLPILASCILIYPREHYQVMQLPLGLVLLSLLLGGPGSGRAAGSTAWNVYYAVLLVTLVALVPRAGGITKNQGKLDDTNLNVIRAIRQLNVSGNVNLLEGEGGYHIYLGENYSWVAIYAKDTGFNAFMKRENVNMVYVSTGMLENYRYRDDAEWHAFLNNYQQYGFRKVPIPRSPYYLLVADALFPQTGAAVP
ncbi:MAG: hypothetical protein AVDCRST_MAG56-3620 [uncultured Cytophagales bacterium]|uniref:Glycosyltransferase RgtA/B/C/D-like domain-containing protein n=1 Tax=uncultured Cytophagales bacterium TaxID=158755 RepID=A0A6J4JHM6_9SPHI|nr:MAG: hypothetical protein AVDCRST_MAG56-3620 [uncultured Cytophagales bacterium]